MAVYCKDCEYREESNLPYPSFYCKHFNGNVEMLGCDEGIPKAKTEDVELKPCPFCGEKESVRLMKRYGKDGWQDRYYVLCEYDNGGCGAESGWCYSEAEAIFAWNTRVIPIN